jgi:hypothetical protein
MGGLHCTPCRSLSLVSVPHAGREGAARL